jgi:hypothetical protein
MLATAAAPGIVLAHSVAGVSLGTRRTALTARIGKGTVVRSGKGSFGPFVVIAYRKPAVRVTFLKGTATTVSTSSRVYRTPEGIAVGTSSSRLHLAYGKRLHCGNFQICEVGNAVAGNSVTTFDLQNAHVVRIDVSTVLD